MFTLFEYIYVCLFLFRFESRLSTSNCMPKRLRIMYVCLYFNSRLSTRCGQYLKTPPNGTVNTQRVIAFFLTEWKRKWEKLYSKKDDILVATEVAKDAIVFSNCPISPVYKLCYLLPCFSLIKQYKNILAAPT
jgi:hypothetical protein